MYVFMLRACVYKSSSTYHNVKVKELQNSLVVYVKAKNWGWFHLFQLSSFFPFNSFTENNFLAPQFFHFAFMEWGKEFLWMKSSFGRTRTRFEEKNVKTGTMVEVYGRRGGGRWTWTITLCSFHLKNVS